MVTTIERPNGIVAIKAELDLDDVIAQVKKIQAVMAAVMHKDEHYGVIRGTQKPTLLQPGAQKLCLTFRLDPQDEVVQATETDDLIAFTVRTTLWHVPSGERIASGLGSCNSREHKYARRDRDGGVQPAWDLHNTILKMAAKRALIAAVLRGTAASDIFTQDVEDLPADRLERRDDATATAVFTISLAQQQAIRKAGEARGLTKDEIIATVQQRYGCAVTALTAAQGAEFIKAIQETPMPATDLPTSEPDANPARREPPPANEKQITAIYEAGGTRGYDVPETDRLSAATYDGRVVASLTSREASAFLAALRSEG